MNQTNKNLGHGGGGSSSSVLHFHDSTSLKSDFWSNIVQIIIIFFSFPFFNFKKVMIFILAFGQWSVFTFYEKDFTNFIWLKGFGSVIQRSAWKERCVICVFWFSLDCLITQRKMCNVCSRFSLENVCSPEFQSQRRHRPSPPTSPKTHSEHPSAITKGKTQHNQRLFAFGCKFVNQDRDMPPHHTINACTLCIL